MIDAWCVYWLVGGVGQLVGQPRVRLWVDMYGYWQELPVHRLEAGRTLPRLRRFLQSGT